MLLLASEVGAAMPAAHAAAEIWILVDTHTLSVRQAGRALRTLRDVAVGRGGVAEVRHRGDQTTPLGEFHVARILWDSPFHAFIGLDYPNRDQAESGYRARLIDRGTYLAIQNALDAGHVPPQDTFLGGHIGIQGLGRGDPAIQRRLDWTKGCIALTNAQIDRLASWVRHGTRMVIR
jgi:murein L,D-transpeptidase YafK